MSALINTVTSVRNIFVCPSHFRFWSCHQSLRVSFCFVNFFTNLFFVIFFHSKAFEEVSFKMLVRSISVKSKEILQQHMPLGKVWRRRGVSEFFINLLIFINYPSIYKKADTLLCLLVRAVILQFWGNISSS